MLDDYLDLKVMVVEDSKMALKSLRKHLINMGFEEPLLATSGEEAVELFRQQRPDIILLDAVMPDMDGFEVARQIRALEEGGAWAAIIFLTVLDQDHDLERGIVAGGDDYLKKPVSERVLQAKILAMSRLIGKHQKQKKQAHVLHESNRKLQQLSTTDKLTGIANRRMFDELARREWRRCDRLKKTMSLIMIDVDHFKRYNDTYGHLAGDKCLKAVAKQVSRAAPRPTDLAARYGGEEFALVLGETGADGASWVANNVRQHVEDLKLPHSASEFGHVTVSCGIASMRPQDGLRLEDLIFAADEALYSAKSKGRNQVIWSEQGGA